MRYNLAGTFQKYVETYVTRLLFRYSYCVQNWLLGKTVDCELEAI